MGQIGDYKLAKGERIGEYELVQFLGAGGMGQTWLASKPSLDKKVVIKVMVPELRDIPQAAEYFKAEGNLGARLHHSNIVNMIDRGPGYIVLEYIEGVTLHRLLEVSKRLPPEWAVYIGVELFKALGYLHRALFNGKRGGLVHRDVTPDNVFITPDAEVKLGDLGIAQIVAALELREATQIPGGIKGKRRYLSPEMAARGEVDQRADIFQVGLILYECLTGAAAFDGTRAGIDNIIKGQFRPIQSLVSDVPPKVVAAVDRLMALSRDDRPTTAELARESIEESCQTFYRADKELARSILRIADLRASTTFDPGEQLRSLYAASVAAAASPKQPEITAPESRSRVVVQAAPEDRTLLDDVPEPKPQPRTPVIGEAVPQVIETDIKRAAPLPRRAEPRMSAPVAEMSSLPTVPLRPSSAAEEAYKRKQRHASPTGSPVVVRGDRTSNWVLVLLGLLLLAAIVMVIITIRSYRLHAAAHVPTTALAQALESVAKESCCSAEKWFG